MGTFKVYAAGDMLTERHIRGAGIVSTVERNKEQGTSLPAGRQGTSKTILYVLQHFYIDT